jgi:hypothetical protein
MQKNGLLHGHCTVKALKARHRLPYRHSDLPLDRPHMAFGGFTPKQHLAKAA